MATKKSNDGRNSNNNTVGSTGGTGRSGLTPRSKEDIKKSLVAKELKSRKATDVQFKTSRALKAPLRYLGNPLRIVGDVANVIGAPSGFPSTGDYYQQDLQDYLKGSSNPKDEVTRNVMNTGALFYNPVGTVTGHAINAIDNAVSSRLNRALNTTSLGGNPAEILNNTVSRTISKNNPISENAGGVVDFNQALTSLNKGNYVDAGINTAFGLSGIIEDSPIPMVNTVDNILEGTKWISNMYDAVGGIEGSKEIASKVKEATTKKPIPTTKGKGYVEGMVPEKYSTLPQYGLGSWLKENATGMLGLASSAASLIPGVGSLLGPALGMVSGAIGANQQAKQAQAQQQQALSQQIIAGLNPQDNPTYAASFKNGGSLNFKSPAAYKTWLAYGHASGEFAKTPGHQKVSIKGNPKTVQHAAGGLMDSLACGGKMKAMGGKMESNNIPDNISIYGNGGTHEQSPLGGVPIGRLGRVEQSEVRYNNYIFSNRF